MAGFKDHFSTQSKDYAKYRPVYPPELYQFIYNHCNGFDTVWDCGTGSGQVAVELAQKFKQVFASDPSDNQIANARLAPGVTYKVAPAEDSGYPDDSFDCITVGQALHWFNHPAFFAEAKRVAKPGCLLAAWTYSDHTINEDVDEAVKHFNENFVGSYWPKERRLVDSGYDEIQFPFALIPVPKMEIAIEIDMYGLIGYLRTWSATQRFIVDQGFDPLEEIYDELLLAWGNPTEEKTIAWPIHMKAGYIK